MISLIIVQGYWIVNAIKIEHERFASNVREALENVVGRVEKEETAQAVIKTLGDSTSDVFVFMDSSNRKGGNFMWKDNEDVTLVPVKRLVRAYARSRDTNKSKQIISHDTTFHTFSINKNGKLLIRDSVYIKKTTLVKNVVDELVSIKEFSGINERITQKQIDSLLSSNLNEKGIDAEFGFEVKNSDSTKAVLSNMANNKGITTGKPYKVELFPDELLAEQSFLYVYFPAQTSYVIKNISFMLGVSAIVILIIIGLFYKTIRLLISQKNLAEIRSDLINNVTHEFKTPLSTVSLACDALTEPELMSSEKSYLKYVDIIRDENKRLQFMVENILNTSLFENGGFILNKVKINLHELLEELIDSFEICISGHEGIIIQELKAVNFILHGDTLHIRNAIANVIDNSIKYSSGKPIVKIKTETINEILRLEIEDNGIGIPKHSVKKIFDTFYRVPTGNVHNVKGYGIGLSYAKKVFELHDATISVVSNTGKGSIFTIEFFQNDNQS